MKSEGAKHAFQFYVIEDCYMAVPPDTITQDAVGEQMKRRCISACPGGAYRYVTTVTKIVLSGRMSG
jgi:hypothetical protein